METKKLGRPRVLTDEERKAKYKEYYQNNKEHRSKYNKEYNIKNKERNKDRVAKRKDGFYYVYLLKDHHYIGITDDLYMRFSRHKTEGRNSENYRIMYATPDRKEALKIEKQYHGMGFFGGNH